MPLRLELGFSRALLAVLALAHVAALFAVWWSSYPMLGQWGFSVLIAVSAWVNLRRHVWRLGKGAVTMLAWDADGVWRLSDAAGHEHLVERRGEHLHTPWLVILNFREEGGARFAAVIPRDALDADAFRRLRMRLRVSAGTTRPTM